MAYMVTPGLYAVGVPDAQSDVLVTANYKLSFDVLRRELKGLNAWILVLDTKGINVWCAAGKKTFGTAELIRRVQAVSLSDQVQHRRLIVPQLGAPGIDAAAVQKETGFRVAYGPVEASDIRAYMQAGYRKTDAMRTVRFPFRNRLILTPLELIPALRYYWKFALGMLLLFGITPQGIIFQQAWQGAAPLLLLVLAAVFTGSVITPAALPWLPFRAFSLKGYCAGLMTMAVMHWGFGVCTCVHPWLVAAAWIFCPAVSSWFALQFTGSTTYTNMSGVQKELKIGIWLYGAAAAISAVLVLAVKVQIWRTL